MIRLQLCQYLDWLEEQASPAQNGALQAAYFVNQFTLCVMSRWYWHIEGHEGTRKIFDRQVQYSYFSETQIKALLMALAAKEGLTYIEILNAYASPKAPTKNKLLHVHRSFGPRPTYTCGDDPWFLATPIQK
jgi:hypothetical protein